MKKIIALTMCVVLGATAAEKEKDDAVKVLKTESNTGHFFLEVKDFPVACNPVTTVPGHEPSLLPADKKFKLVWNDEFDGDTLDESKWMYRTNFWGRDAYWFAKPEHGCVEVKGGKVHLKLKRLENGQYVSPQLQTGCLLWDIPHVEKRSTFWPLPKREKPKFVHRYGYYECRCTLQQLPGWWSAFWMQTEAQGTTLDPGMSGIEQDIMESFDPGEVLPACFHYNGYGPDYKSFYIPDCKIDALSMLRVDKTKEHVFGLLWEESGYSLYVDGRFRGRNAKAVSHVPQFLLISTEAKWYRNNLMTGKGVPELKAAAEAGDKFTVNYVRVYDVVK